MAGNRKFHNKFHSANHHTLPSPHIVDSGLDPIASHDFPFIGDFVLNGTLSASNNYLLNGIRTRTHTLDDIPHGTDPISLGLPGDWNIFRNSTYIDGDTVITGNLSAVGELTYLHTQVYSTSANEIDVRANNSNGRSTGLRIDQHGTNDVLHVYNDAVSTLLITGSADQLISQPVKNSGGQLGINLGSLDDIDRPNQRMTIVGSVSVVGDPYEYLSQDQQADSGKTGSLYIEGGLHVNDKTFLDQVTIDTTDGKTYVSGAGNPGEENPVDIDVPVLLDRTTIDTTDGDTFITGTNKVYIDTNQGLVVDTHTQLDQLTVNTTDGDMLIEGSNWLRVEVPADFNKHVNLDSTHINTDDGNFVVSGGNKIYVDTTGGLDVDTHTQLDRLTVDTADGKMYVKGNNIVDIESHTHLDQVTIDTTSGKTFISGNQIVDIESHTHLSQLTVDTTSGKTYIFGTNVVDIDAETLLDKTTIDTEDGRALITHPSNTYSDRNPIAVNVPAELTQTTVDTTSGDFNVIGTGDFILDHSGTFRVETDTELNKLTVDVTKGDFLIKGKASGNIFDVNVNTSFNDATLSAGDVHITTGADKDMLVDGGGRVDYKTEVFFDNEVELDKTTIDTTDGEFRVHSTDWEEGRVQWVDTQEMRVTVPSLFQSLTADTTNQETVIKGLNRTLVLTPAEFHKPVLMTDTVDMTDQVTINNLSVSGFTDLDETHIDTTDGDFIVSGSGDTNIQTYAVFDDSVYIKGNLRVDGNAWLSAGYDGSIHVGDTDGDRVLFHADVDSDILPNVSDIFRLGRPSKRWLDVNSHTGTFHDVHVDNALIVDGKAELDETQIHTDDGSFIISGSESSIFYTDVNLKNGLTLEGQLSATKGPWRFTGCELNPAYYSGDINPSDQTTGSVDNTALSNLPYHQFQVDCNSLFSRGLTANGPVQIGELPDGVTDELFEPTLEVLGNLHVREGNIKIVSDIRHLEDENTLIRFKPDLIEFRAGDAPLLTLTEKTSADGRDIVEIGTQDSPTDLKLYKQSPSEPAGITFNSKTGETRFDGNVGIHGDNEAAAVIGEGLDVHGSVRVTETLSAKNLIVDFITVQEDSFGNIGGGGTGGGSELAPVSGIATAGGTTTEYVAGNNITYEGTPVGITFDITEEQNTIQKLFSFTFEAQSADTALGINIGDVQTTTYQFAAKWDEYWSEAFVNDVEYGIVHTSDNPFAEISSVVLSATSVPTNERIVKIIVKPTVDLKFFSHNVLAQIKPKRLNTVTTADFDVNGDLSVFGQVSAAQGLIVDGSHLLKGEVTYLSAATFEDDVTFKKHVDIKELAIGDGGLYVKGDLRVDGNAYLSAGAGGVINVGDSTDDIINFTADVASDIIPNIDSRYTLGSTAARWQTLHTRNVSASGLIDLDGRQIIRGVADQFYYKRPGSEFSDFTPAYFWSQIDINENIKTDQVLKLLSMSDQEVTVELENGSTQTLNVLEQYTDGANESYSVNESIFFGESFMGYDWSITSYHSSAWSQPATILEYQNSVVDSLTGLDNNDPTDDRIMLSTVYGPTPDKSANYINVQHDTPFVLTSDSNNLDVYIDVELIQYNQNGGQTSMMLSVEIDGAIYSRHIDDVGPAVNISQLVHLIPSEFSLLWDPQGNAPMYPEFKTGKSVKFGFWFGNGTTGANAIITHDISIYQLAIRIQLPVSNPSTPDLIPGTYIRGTAWELAERSELWEALTVFGNSMLSGAATIRDNIHGQSDFRLDGNASLSGTLDVGADTTLHQNLVVSGTANVGGDVHFESEATIDGKTQINNNTEITGTLTVSGETNIGDKLHVEDDLRVDSNTYLSGGVSIGCPDYSDLKATLKYLVYIPGHPDATGNAPEAEYTRVIDLSANQQQLVDYSFYESIWSLPPHSVPPSTWDLYSVTIEVSGSDFETSPLPVTVRDVSHEPHVFSNGQSGHSYQGTIDIPDISAFLPPALSVCGSAVLDSDLHVKGDLRVDGNAYLSAGSDGVINVGDVDSDRVVFHADIDSDIMPDRSMEYNIGSQNKHWMSIYAHNYWAHGSADITQNLDVGGNTRLNGTLTVSGETLIDDDITITGNTSLSGTLDVDLDTTLNSDLIVNNNTYLSGAGTVDGDIQGNSNLTIDGDTSLSGSATIAGYTTVDDELLVTGTTKLSGHLEVDDHADIHGDVNVHGLTATKHTYLKEDLDVDGDVVIGKNLSVGESTNITGELTVGDKSTFNDNVYIKGDLRVDGNAYLSAGASGSINVGDTETDIVIFNADIGSDILPDITDKYNLGIANKAWNEVHWAGGNSLESNSVYDFVNSTSGEWGYANLSAYKDDRYVLRHDQVPDLAITHVHRVTNTSLVVTLKENILRGDIVLVADTEDNLVAIADHPDGDYDKETAEYVGYERLFAPGNMVRFINGYQGPSVTLTPDDFDDTDTDHKFVDQNQIDDLHSVYTNVNVSSAARESVYITTNASSGDWYDTRNSMMATSGDWDDARSSVMATSGDWDDARSSVMATSGDWDDTRNSMMATSGDWDDARSSVMATSGDWDSVYSFVNSDSATNNTDYNQTTFINASGDTVTGELIVDQFLGTVNLDVSNDTTTNNLSAHRIKTVNDIESASVNTGTINANHASFTSMTAVSSFIDVIDIKVRELSGFDIIDGDLTVQGGISAEGRIEGDHASFGQFGSTNLGLTVYGITQLQGDIYTTGNINLQEGKIINTTGGKGSDDWTSVYNSVVSTSSNWDSAYTTTKANSAWWAENAADISNIAATSGDWNDARTTLNASSGDWYDTRSSVIATSGDWNDARTTLNASSGDWYDARNSVIATSGDWNDARTTLNASSGDWYDARNSVIATSGDWDSVYSHVNTTSGYGYATVGSDGKLEEHLVPNLSITETYVVTYDSSVEELCDGSLQGTVDIERGDVVIITATEQNLIAVVDSPTGVYHQGFDTFDGFSKLQTPTDYIKTINGKQGLMVTLNPDDLDDTLTAHKFVEEQQKENWDSTYATVCAASAEWNSVYTSVNDTSAEWDSVYSFVNSDSATNNTDYNQTTFVNASGDTITGDLIIEGELSVDSDVYLKATTTASTFEVSGHTTLNTLNVSGSTILDSTFDVNDNSVFHKNVHIKGDLRVDGNAFLSAGSDGNINVGDADTDNVIFRADVDSNFLADKKDTYTLGSEAKRWLATYSLSGLFHYVDIHDLDVSGVTKLTGKSSNQSGPGVIVRGIPTGIFDEAPYGFDDNGVPRADYMIPDVDIVGDVALHGSLSADNAHIYSLTASHFKAEYEKLTINDGDMEMLNGSFKQRGGNVLIESDLGHVDDENTYMRFQPDEITFTCHDVQMLRFQELTTGDDIISIGDASDAVDIIVQNPADTKTLYIDGDTGYIGIGINNPSEKLHVGHGQVQFASGDKNGAVMLTSGTTQDRVDKTGSIRWNNELNRYEGYRDDTDSWVSLQGIGDTDGDTYISADAGNYPDSDRLSIYTVGCSAMTVYPNQTVAFAGDIQFDNITIYDNNSVTGPLTATSEFIYLKVNGKDRAIRLWATPEDTREDVETFHGESVTHIGDECGLGLGGQIPTQTISAHPVLNNPPTQRTDVDSDGDGIIDYLDTDDDGDGIPDYMDADHPLTDGMADADGDGIADPYDDDMFEGTHKWSGGGKTWGSINTPWESLSGNNK